MNRNKNKNNKKNNEKLKKVCIEQNKGNQIIDEDNKEKVQRRNTRLAAIVAIVAIVGTICVFVLKLAIASLNLWASEGFVYWYLQIMMFATLSMALILAFRVLDFIFNDLKRHNILDKDYLKYDDISDAKYNLLIMDCKFYIYTLFSLLILEFSQNAIQKMNNTILSTNQPFFEVIRKSSFKKNAL